MKNTWNINNSNLGSGQAPDPQSNSHPGPGQVPDPQDHRRLSQLRRLDLHLGSCHQEKKTSATLPMTTKPWRLCQPRLHDLHLGSCHQTNHRRLRQLSIPIPVLGKSQTPNQRQFYPLGPHPSWVLIAQLEGANEAE